jgi:pimeloyl-ACP methyl ester carboxylesterase
MSEITVNGVRLDYQVRGEGPPILLVCGTGQGAASWAAAADAFVAAGHEVTTFDNRGMPPSEVTPGPYSVAGLADDAIALLEHLGGGPRVLMGSSLGGLITQTVALRRPDLVRAAVFLMGCGNFSHYARTMMQCDVDLNRAGVTLPPAMTALRYVELMMAPDSRGDNDTFDALMSMADILGTPDMVGFEGQLEADLAWAKEDHVTELAGLAVPALVFACQHDPNFPPGLGREAAAAMPNGTFVEVEGANHVPIEQFGFITEQILKFLSSLPS